MASLRGGEGIMGLFEEASDHIRSQVGLLCFRCRGGVVKDCNDGNEGNCISEGNLVVIGAFWNLSAMAMVALAFPCPI
jgi:hypothetical protein